MIKTKNPVFTSRFHTDIMEIIIENPPHVQLPLIKQVVEHLQQKGICKCDSVSATSVNWVVDRILGKL